MSYGYVPPPESLLPTITTPTPQRRKRRIFMWIFLAIQALFIIWLIAAIISVNSHGGITAYCQKAANSQYIGVHGCNDAASTGSALGFIALFGVWIGVDFLVAVPYLIYRLARSR
jgi:hypothetical protein